MGILSKHRNTLMRVLRYLNTKPGFNQLFYRIHEIRCAQFKQNTFVATTINDSFLLGIYGVNSSSTWRRMVAGNFEKSETEIVRKLVPFFDVFVDIGGHIGYFSCLVANLKSETTIFAFEPNPENFRSLTKNIEMNGSRNAKAFNIGLAEKSGTAMLFGKDAGGSIDTRVFDIQPKEKTEVKIEILDSFLPQIPKDKNVFIKIDVEGAEYAAFKGGMNFIRSAKPVGILAEIVRHWSGTENPHFKETFSLLHKLGYTSYIVDEALPLKKTSDNIDNLTGGNYLFIRNDMVKEISAKTDIL